MTDRSLQPPSPTATAPRRRGGAATAVFVVLLVLLLAAAAARLCIGQTFGWPDGDLGQSLWRLAIADWADHWWPSLFEPSGSLTVMDLRLTRVVIAIIVGASLACSGVALQALLRNPLAEPYILGLSSGAALGVMAQSLLFYYLHLRLGAGHVGALLGAAATMLIVYAVSRRRGMIDPLGLLLTGVVVSTINGAIIMLLNYLVGPGGLRENLIHWLMGYLSESVSSATIMTVALVALASIGVLTRLGPAMDVASFSDAEAISLGLNLMRLRTTLFLLASILAAGAVVLAGPIAFVGLICPHLIRALLGPAHRALVIGSALTGAILILLADLAAVGLDRAMGVGLMPIGIFTAMIGGPVFLWMLRPQLGRDTE